MEQIEKLKELSNKMVEIVLIEADPDTWPGANITLEQMSKTERGDRYWSKKNANQGITTAVKLETLIALLERRKGEVNPKKMDDLEAQVISFEEQAKLRLKKLSNG